MKFRVRSLETKSTTTIQIHSPSSLQDLKIAIANQLLVPIDGLHLSLNRKDELDSQPQETLQSLGLASGDLIFYTLSQNGFSTVASNQTAPQEIPLVQTGSTSQSSLVCDSNLHVLEFSPPTDKYSIVSEETMDMDIDANDEADESLMVKPCSVPSLLKRFLSKEGGNNTKGGCGSLIIAVHAIMLESGFVSFDCGTKKTVGGFGLPEGWSSNSAVALFYTVPELEEPDLVVGVVTLKFLIHGDFLLVYGLVGKGSDLYRLSLSVSRFAPSIDYACNSEKYLGNPSKLSHEKEVFDLWKMVKDELSLPTLTVLCEKNKLIPPPSLMLLPTDLKLKVLEFLPGVDIAKIGCVCVELKYLSQNDDLWKKKIVEEFGHMDVMGQPGSLSWKDNFARLLKRAKRAVTVPRRRSHPFALPQFRRLHPRPHGPPVFPFIGGEFDRFPAIGDGPFLPPYGSFRRFGGRQSFTPPCNLGGSGNMGN